MKQIEVKLKLCVKGSCSLQWVMNKVEGALRRTYANKNREDDGILSVSFVEIGEVYEKTDEAALIASGKKVRCPHCGELTSPTQ